MDTAQWPQEIVVKPLEENTIAKQSSSLERKTTTRPHKKEQALNCPRCNSTNTKFCYYNNYSLTQPRYFCKTCKRYWTEGGSLRNIPVGGGSNKKHKNMIRSDHINSSPSSSNNLKKFPDPAISHHQNFDPNPNSNKILQQGQDRNLSFTSQLVQVHQPLVSNEANNKTQISALELLTGISSRGLNLNSSFMPMDDPNLGYNNNNNTSGFDINNGNLMHDEHLKPAANLSFSLDGFGIGGESGFNNLQESGNSGRLLFPFEDLHHQQVSTISEADQITNNKNNHGDSSSGYWSGMLGDGSW